MNTTDQFIEKIQALFRQEIPTHVMHRTRLALLDYIGVTLAGTTGLKDKLKSYLQNELPEPGTTTVIGLGRKLNMKEAVFLNGLHAHALDFDDGTNTGIIHLGSPVFSVLLPLAERYHIDSDKFLKAAIIGYETSFTMAVSIQPKHKQLGYHATGTCGVLGIAMAVAYLLDFTSEQTKNAFATACASATGMLQVLDDGSELKPYNVAKTALLGLTAAQLARAGFAGNPDALGSYRGFLKMMTGDEATVIREPLLDGTYAVEKAYTKPYAACRYCHPSIEAAIQLGAEHGIRKEDVAAIDIRTYNLAVKGHDHTAIPSTASAKMSIPFSVASGLIYGKAEYQEYDEAHIQNNDVLALTKKVSVTADEGLSVLFPKTTTAIVRIHTVSGMCFEKRVDFPKGEPENPLTADEFTDRFIELAVYGGKTTEEARQIMAFVDSMNGPMDGLFQLL